MQTYIIFSFVLCVSAGLYDNYFNKVVDRWRKFINGGYFGITGGGSSGLPGLGGNSGLPGFGLGSGARGATLKGGLTEDFKSFLASNPKYSNHPLAWFDRPDQSGYGSYGGKESANQQIKNQPVIFIHGNSDKALNSGGGPYQTGWTKSIEYFQSQGYTSAELYATTWGPAQSFQSTQQTHNCKYLQLLRSFVEAVLDYTQAEQVDVIGHSMGVTLARKVIKGGPTANGKCDLGQPLTDKVDTFLGLAGANYGLSSCKYATIIATCNTDNGFSPSSAYLKELNEGGKYEGSHVYYMYSTQDEIIGQTDRELGRPSEEIPHADGSKKFGSFGHMQVKDETVKEQLAAVRDHQI